MFRLFGKKMWSVDITEIRAHSLIVGMESRQNKIRPLSREKRFHFTVCFITSKNKKILVKKIKIDYLLSCILVM